MKKKILIGKLVYLILILFMSVSILAISCAEPAPSPSPTPAPAPPKELKIGAICSLSGPGSENLARNAVGEQAAVDSINENGGLTVNGEHYTIKLIIEDNKVSPEGSVTAATKLVYDDKVKFMLGIPIGPFKAGVNPITESNEVLRVDISMVAPAGELGPDFPYVFCDVTNIGAYEPALDYFIGAYPDVKRLALIASEDPAAHMVNEDFRIKAAERNLEVVAEEYYPFGTNDYYPVLTKILNAKPDAIVSTIGFSTWTGAICKQGREMGYKGPFLQTSNPSGDIGDILRVAGPEYTTDFVVIGCDLTDKTLQTAMMKDAITYMEEKGYANPVTLDHLLGWEVTMIMKQAIEHAQSLDPTVVRDSFQKMTSIEALYGTATMGGQKTFGINNLVVGPYPLTKFVNGKMQFIKWCSPEIP